VKHVKSFLELFRSGPKSRLLRGRKQLGRSFVRLVLVFGVLAGVGYFVARVGRHAGFDCLGHSGRTINVEVAGTSARADPLLASCSPKGVTGPLEFDSFVFIPLYVVALGGACALLGPVGYRVKGFRRAAAPLAALVFVAGVLDEIENVALRRGLSTNTPLHMGNLAATIAGAAAWPKLIVLAIALVYVLVAAFGYAANPFIPQARWFWTGTPSDDVKPNAPVQAVAPRTPGPTVGISLSGGGVRAATYGLGALQTLDQRDLVSRSNYLSAVSGGSYMAGAWTIARSYATLDHDPSQRPWADGSPEVRHFRSRLDYLRSRTGGLAGAVATLVLGVVVNVGGLLLLLWLIARPLGWLVGSPLIGATRGKFAIGRHVWFPPLAWSAITVFLLVVWVLLQRVRTLPFLRKLRGLRSASFVLVVFSGLLTALQAIVLLAVPAAIGAVRHPSATAHWVQSVLGIGVVGTVIGVLRRPAQKYISRAGGLLVLLFGVAFGGEIAWQATLSSFHRERVTYLLMLAGFVVFYFSADPDWWSIQPYYRGRLRFAYASRRDGDKDGLKDFENEPEKSLADYQAQPELVVCTAMNVSGRGVPMRVGLPAYSFTFTPSEIGFNDPALDEGVGVKYSCPTRRYASVFERWDTPKLGVMTAVGMSGAAISPAMGRFKRGSTGALLALANVRLGMWMPNPRYVASAPGDDDRPAFPRRRLSYLLKEMFGIHDIEDIYVYVTDGGHWENLGVVELLRRRCTEVFCFDAAGSMTDSFGRPRAKCRGRTRLRTLARRPVGLATRSLRQARLRRRSHPLRRKRKGIVLVRQGQPHPRRAVAAARLQREARHLPLPSNG
jgi:hypothetical protein